MPRVTVVPKLQISGLSVGHDPTVKLTRQISLCAARVEQFATWGSSAALSPLQLSLIF